MLRSLRLRLALGIAIMVAAATTAGGWMVLHTARRSLTEEVQAAGVRMAERAAREVARWPTPLATDELQAVLSLLEDSSAEVDQVTLFVQDPEGLHVVANTGMPPSAGELSLATEASVRRQQQVHRQAEVIYVASPSTLADGTPGVVVLRVDLGGALALQQQGIRVIVVFAVLVSVVLIALVDGLAWALVYRPVRDLQDAMARAAAGDLATRARVLRHDELGAVAVGLNQMLEELEQLNNSLQSRVRDATAELQERNQQLVESYQRVFALREQLANAEQLAAVGQTAANVAHQVGTPLNLISGYVQLLKEEIGPDSALTSRIAVIEEQVEKVTSTVRTLLDRSRQIGQRRRTTAARLLEQVSDAMRPTLEAAGITLQVETAGADTPILVDTTNLELVLLNLMTNAVDAMPDGGALTIRVDDEARGRVRIDIADTGHGIPKDLLPRIFDPWVSTKQVGRGAGLGLAIARDVVSAHGGTIAVASEIGQGTTFTIELPADSGREVSTSVS